MPLEASTDLLAGQWQRSERFLAAVDAPLGAIRDEVLPAFDALEKQRHIDTAEGAWLDYLGTRAGIDRPSVPTDATDARFGFEGFGTGFDRAPFHGASELAPLVPLPDAVFRRFVRARGVLIFGRGTFQEFYVACRHIDPGCRVVDNRDMTVSVVTTMGKTFELADSVGALPRPAGVLVIYSEPGRWGFEGFGEPWDTAPFRGSGGAVYVVTSGRPAAAGATTRARCASSLSARRTMKPCAS